MAYCYPRGKVWWIGFIDEKGESKRIPTKIVIGKLKDERRDSEFRATAYARKREEKAEQVRLGFAEPDVQPMLFEELAGKYLSIRAARKRSAETIECRIRGHIIPHFKGRMSHVITPSDIEEFLGFRARGVACTDCKQKACDGKGETKAACACGKKCHRKQRPETLNKLRNHISAIFRYGIEAAKCIKGANPVRASERVTIPKHEPRVVPEEYLADFLAVAEDDVRGIFAVLLYTGVRKIEALLIRVEDVDLERGTITIIDRKTDDWRPVPIPPGLVPYLKVELGRVRSEWLFPNDKGEPHSSDWRLHERVRTTLLRAGLIEGWNHKCRRCKTSKRHPDNAERRCEACSMKLWASAVRPKYTVKDLRSTFGTLAYEELRDSKFVQKALGHKDARTTEKYVKMRQKHLVAQGAKLKLVGSTHNQLTREIPPASADTEAEG